MLGTHLWSPWVVLGAYLLTETIWPWVKKQTLLRPLVDLVKTQIQGALTSPTELDELDDDETSQQDNEGQPR